MDTLTKARDRWQQIWEQVYATGDEQLQTGLVIAMENASATVSEEGLTNQDDLWFETAIWTWDEWQEAPYGIDGGD